MAVRHQHARKPAALKVLADGTDMIGMAAPASMSAGSAPSNSQVLVPARHRTGVAGETEDGRVFHGSRRIPSEKLVPGPGVTGERALYEGYEARVSLALSNSSLGRGTAWGHSDEMGPGTTGPIM